jgi:hypothetical protein
MRPSIVSIFVVEELLMRCNRFKKMSRRTNYRPVTDIIDAVSQIGKRGKGNQLLIGGCFSKYQLFFVFPGFFHFIS